MSKEHLLFRQAAFGSRDNGKREHQSVFCRSPVDGSRKQLQYFSARKRPILSCSSAVSRRSRYFLLSSSFSLMISILGFTCFFIFESACAAGLLTLSTLPNIHPVFCSGIRQIIFPLHPDFFSDGNHQRLCNKQAGL